MRGKNKLDSLKLEWTAGDTAQLPDELELAYSVWVELSAFPIDWSDEAEPIDFSKLNMDEDSWGRYSRRTLWIQKHL